MTRRSAKLRNWADIARKRAEEVQAPNEAGQLMELAEDLDELAQVYDAARRSSRRTQDRRGSTAGAGNIAGGAVGSRVANPAI